MSATLTTRLEKRLTVLEQGVEAARVREIRELVTSLPEASGLTPAELEEATRLAAAELKRVAEWRRAGVSEREIVRRCASECGITVAEYEAAMAALR